MECLEGFEEADASHLAQAIKDEVHSTLLHPERFYFDPHNLNVLHDILKECGIRYEVSSDLFVRLNDGFVDRKLAEFEKANLPEEGMKQNRFIEGTAASCPSLYVERSAGTPWDGDQDQGEAAMSRVWVTRFHNEFGLLPFINLMLFGGSPSVNLDSLEKVTIMQLLELRDKWEAFKVWVTIKDDGNDTPGGNLERLNAYARYLGCPDGWHQFLNYYGGHRPVVKLEDILSFGIDIIVAFQRPGDIAIGGPGVCHLVGPSARLLGVTNETDWLG